MKVGIKFILVLALMMPVAQAKDFSKIKKLAVTATAYNSLPGQTDKTPRLAAWNNKIKPGDKIIAVSRDLLGMGLTNGVRVKIVGLSGWYTVRDKMNKRWKKKIDIYMGDSKGRAMRWGKRKVTIVFQPKQAKKVVLALN